MTLSTPARHPGLFAVLGAVLSLPALLLFVSGMIQYATGAEIALLPTALLHPAILLGGLLVALCLNALVALRLDHGTDAEGYAFTLHLARRPANLAVLGLALFLLGAVVTYGFVENVLTGLP